MSYDRSFMPAFYCVCLFVCFHEDRTCRMLFFFFFNVPDFAFLFVLLFCFFGIFWPCSVACRILVL